MNTYFVAALSGVWRDSWSLNPEALLDHLVLLSVHHSYLICLLLNLLKQDRKVS